MLTTLKTEHKKEMTELDKGDKPTDDIIKLIVSVANEAMQAYKTEEAPEGSKK